MATISLNVSQSIINEINKKIQKINNNPKIVLSANDITREALAVYKWTVNQIENGYDVYSIKERTNMRERFNTPNLKSNRN